jgi:CheY-like chemotaxis protein
MLMAPSHHQSDRILLDNRLPDATGLETIAEIERSAGRPPILLLLLAGQCIPAFGLAGETF